MDKWPLRTPGPTAGAGERERQHAATAQPQRTEAPMESRPMESSRRAAPSRQPHHRRKAPAPWLWIAILLAVIILGLSGWFIWSNVASTSPKIDSNKYQAVFFTNGQVYFGKLTYTKSEYMQLSDVFYIQSSSSASGTSDATQGANSSSSMKLIKLGEEVHGPEDTMMIAKSQVLFYENLRDDGKVAQQIEKYNSGN